MRVCAHEYRCPQRPREGIRSAGVIGDCECWMWVLGTKAGFSERADMLSAQPPRESVSLSRAWFSGTCTHGMCIRGTCIRGLCTHAPSCPRPYQPPFFPVLSKSLWHQAPDGKDGVSSYRVLNSELLFTVRVSKLCLMKGVPEFFTFEDST